MKSALPAANAQQDLRLTLSLHAQPATTAIAGTVAGRKIEDFSI